MLMVSSQSYNVPVTSCETVFYWLNHAKISLIRVLVHLNPAAY